MLFEESNISVCVYMKLEQRVLPLLIVFVLFAGILCMAGAADARVEVTPNPGGDGTWTYEWYREVNFINMSASGAPNQWAQEFAYQDQSNILLILPS